MLAFALDRGYAVERRSPRFALWAASAGIEVAVASDGFGFYVGPMLERREPGASGSGERDLVLQGPAPGVPFGHPSLVGCGTCKILACSVPRDASGPVAFVGEGTPTLRGAVRGPWFRQAASVDICDRDGVPHCHGRRSTTS